MLAAGWRSRHWQRQWLPTAAAIRATLAWGRWYGTGNGLANERPPSTLWIWVALTRRGGDGVDPRLAQRAVVAPRRGRCWPCPLSAQRDLDTLNLWVVLPDRADRVEPPPARCPTRPRSGRCCRALAHGGVRPSHGTLLPVVIPLPTHHAIAANWMYLPPAWFDRGIVREPSAAAAADGDDDRRSIQHTRRLGAGR